MTDHAATAHQGLVLLSSMVARGESHTLASADACRSAHRSIAALEQELAEAKQERDKLLSKQVFNRARAEAAEAELAELVARVTELEAALRDEMKWDMGGVPENEWKARAEAAELALDAATKALRKIANIDPDATFAPRATLHKAVSIARSLAATEDTPLGGFINQPTKREMGVDAPDFGPTLAREGCPYGCSSNDNANTPCPHCDRRTTKQERLQAMADKVKGWPHYLQIVSSAKNLPRRSLSYEPDPHDVGVVGHRAHSPKASGCIVCARCDRHTGNGNQGHYWSWCKKTDKLEGFHFCCPDLPCEYPEDDDPPTVRTQGVH